MNVEHVMKIGDLVECHFTGKIGITIKSAGSSVPTFPRWKWQPLEFLVKWEWGVGDETWATAMYLKLLS